MTAACAQEVTSGHLESQAAPSVADGASDEAPAANALGASTSAEVVHALSVDAIDQSALPDGFHHVRTIDVGDGTTSELYGTDQYDKAMAPDGWALDLGPLIVINNTVPVPSYQASTDGAKSARLAQEFGGEASLTALSEDELILSVEVDGGFLEFIGKGVDEATLEEFASAAAHGYEEGK